MLKGATEQANNVDFPFQPNNQQDRENSLSVVPSILLHLLSFLFVAEVFHKPSLILVSFAYAVR